MMINKPRRLLIASLPFATLALGAMVAATSAPQPFPTREEIAAMLVANVPALSDAADPSDYAVLVLDANSNFVTATSGQGNLVVQVWGDQLDDVARAARTAERKGLAQMVAVRRTTDGAADAGGGAGGRARSGGGGDAATARVAGGAVAGAGGRAVRGTVSGDAVVVGRGGAGVVADGGRVIDRTATSAGAGGARSSTGDAVVAVRGAAGPRGGGAGGAVASGGSVAISTRRMIFRSPSSTWSMRGPNGEMLALGGPANGYVAGFTFEVSDAATGAKQPSVMNDAVGLHALSGAGADESGINGIPASSLTSLETYTYRNELGLRDVRVIVVTTNSGVR